MCKSFSREKMNISTIINNQEKFLSLTTWNSIILDNLYWNHLRILMLNDYLKFNTWCFESRICQDSKAGLNFCNEYVLMVCCCYYNTKPTRQKILFCLSTSEGEKFGGLDQANPLFLLFRCFWVSINQLTASETLAKAA